MGGVTVFTSCRRDSRARLQSLDTGNAIASRRAFSLIELLVVIGVMGLMIGILLPTLAGARAAADRAKTLSNLRQLSVYFSAYEEEYRSYPFHDTKTQLDLPPEYNGGAWGTGGDYTSIASRWNFLIAYVVDLREIVDILRSPRSIPSDGHGFYYPPLYAYSSFSYCTTFSARPEVWGPTKPADPESLVSGVRAADVLFPSRKVMLFDREARYTQAGRRGESLDNETIPMLFPDGHAAAHRFGSSAEPSINWSRAHRTPRRLHDTPSGVHGADY